MRIEVKCKCGDSAVFVGNTNYANGPTENVTGLYREWQEKHAICRDQVTVSEWPTNRLVKLNVKWDALNDRWDVSNDR